MQSCTHNLGYGAMDVMGSCVAAPADSLFVLLPGRSREEAFRIGNDIAQAVTAVNPPPVTLKMEKVGDDSTTWGPAASRLP